ncbi:MAG: hypothetical protein M3Y56_13615 [Armatimonadota bacterium]|nr:hypothetical protein [Armatimonadota bacterium]
MQPPSYSAFIPFYLLLTLSVSTSNLHAAAPAVPAHPTLLIGVAADAPAVIQAAAQRVLQAAGAHPLLSVMAGGSPVTALTPSAALLAAPASERAYHHLVLIGLPTDPLITAAWQREARVEGAGFYIFGFGHLQGDLGYIESDRNPFLHGAAIATAPFETEVVTLTGSTPAGVALAVDAFLKQGLVNGVVAAPGWTRPHPNLLQRDPLSPDFSLPTWLPDRAGAMTRIGVTQAAEDEYRGVLADTGVEPRQLWRAKYYRAGVWDGAGAAAAFDDYSNGLHRRAYGNTLWLALFASPQEAAAAAPKIARAAHLHRDGARWTGAQPPYSFDKASAGPLTLWQHDDWIVMSTLPPSDNAALTR